MSKAVVFAVIAMLVLLAACGGNKIQAKPLSSRSPTAAVINQAVSTPAPVAPTPNLTASEAFKELQEQLKNAPVATGPKTGTTGMPPAPKGVTGKDALLARMRSLMNQSVGVKGVTNVTTEFPDYSKKSNLPPGYGEESPY